MVLLKGKLSEVHENFEEFHWASEEKVAQSCLTLCNPMDYIVRRLLQARILEWVAFPFSKGSSQPSDWTQFSRISGRFFTSWAMREAKEYWSGQPILSPGDLPDPGIESGSPALEADSLPTELSGEPFFVQTLKQIRQHQTENGWELRGRCGSNLWKLMLKLKWWPHLRKPSWLAVISC